jgi:hypothetical protein
LNVWGSKAASATSPCPASFGSAVSLSNHARPVGEDLILFGNETDFLQTSPLLVGFTFYLFRRGRCSSDGLFDYGHKIRLFIWFGKNA